MGGAYRSWVQILVQFTFSPPSSQEPQRVQEVGSPPGPDLPREPDPEETIRNLQAQLSAALAEIETVRAVAAVSEGTKHEAVEAVRRRCQEDVASLQTILKGERT